MALLINPAAASVINLLLLCNCWRRGLGVGLVSDDADCGQGLARPAAVATAAARPISLPTSAHLTWMSCISLLTAARQGRLSCCCLSAIAGVKNWQLVRCVVCCCGGQQQFLYLLYSPAWDDNAA